LAFGLHGDTLFTSYVDLNDPKANSYVRRLVLRVGGDQSSKNQGSKQQSSKNQSRDQDCEDQPSKDQSREDRCCDGDLGPDPTDPRLIRSIENCYAEFCQLLLRNVLIPYWDEERVAFVEDCGGSGSNKRAAEKAAEDQFCKLSSLMAEAEEDKP